MMFTRTLRQSLGLARNVFPSGFYTAKIVHPKLTKEAIEETLSKLETLTLEEATEAHQLGMSHDHKLMNIVREAPGIDAQPTIIFRVMSPGQVVRTNLEGGVQLPAGTIIQPKIVNPTGAKTLYQVPETVDISARAAAGRGESGQVGSSPMKTVYPKQP